ncbi:MAG TPA: response regulator [Flavobacterium sp.]|nr:response regulator [Flavobacterium sp.]
MKQTKDKLHVILTDDMEEEHFLFRKALGELLLADIEVLCFFSADELFAYFNSSEFVAPHVLFLDLNMPEKTGLECLKEIRADERLKELIVAIYSVSASESDVSKTLAEGANIYITKPREFEEMKRVLNEVIKSCIQYHSLHLSFDTFIRSL